MFNAWNSEAQPNHANTNNGIENNALPAVGTPAWSAQLALTHSATPVIHLPYEFLSNLYNPENNPIQVILETYKPTVPADNIARAIAQLALHDLAHFTQHYQGMIAEMQKNRAHACIWAKAYIDTRKIFSALDFNQIIQSKFFNDNLAVMGKYYTLSKVTHPETPVTMDNKLRINTTQLILLDKTFAGAILTLGNNATKEDFENLVNARHALQFPPPMKYEPAAKKPRTAY